MAANSMSEIFTLISLHQEEINDKSFTLKTKNRCIVTAIILDYILTQKMNSGDDKYFWDKPIEFDSEIDNSIYQALNMDDCRRSISEWMETVQNMTDKSCTQIADMQKSKLLNNHLLEEIPSLLECDLYYEDSGIKIKQYRAKAHPYKATLEHIKEEVLDNKLLSNYVLCLLWLMTQSNDLSKIYSIIESDTIHEKYLQCYESDRFAHSLLDNSIKTNGASGWKRFMEAEKKFTQSKFGVGLVSRIPIIERKEAIFIATEKMFSNDLERFLDVQKKLESHGHICTIYSTGKVPLMEIDNVLYELIPDAVRVRVVNVHGVRLRRYLR